MKVAVIGDRDTISGFKLAGCVGYVVNTPQEAREELQRQAAQTDIGLILITERIAEQIRPTFKRITQTFKTPILEIPDKSGPLAEKSEAIDELIRRAVGVEIKY